MASYKKRVMQEFSSSVPWGNVACKITPLLLGYWYDLSFHFMLVYMISSIFYIYCVIYFEYIYNLFQIFLPFLEALLDANEGVKMSCILWEKTVGMTRRETYLSRELFLELCLIISQSSRHDHVFPKSQNWKQHLDVFQMAAQYPVIIYWSKTIKWWNKIKWNSFCSLNLPSKIKNRDTKEKGKNMHCLTHRTEVAHYVP